MRLIAVSVLVLVVVVAAAAGVSIYTWGWRNNGTPEQSAESTERAEALGAARELSLAYANHIRYIRFGDGVSFHGVEQLGPGRWLAHLRWNGANRCQVIELDRFAYKRWDRSLGPEFSGVPASAAVSASRCQFGATRANQRQAAAELRTVIRERLAPYRRRQDRAASA
jgi:hypothetical protein